MSNPDDLSAIHRAVMRHSLSEVIAALDGGDDVDRLDREQRSPIFYAAKDGDDDIVTELIARRADVNLPDRNLETPLHFAAREYRTGAADLLVRGGARVDATDTNGNTPLWRAVFESRGRPDMIRLLLAAGADKTKTNRHGVSPAGLAATIANYDVTALLG